MTVKRPKGFVVWVPALLCSVLLLAGARVPASGQASPGGAATPSLPLTSHAVARWADEALTSAARGGNLGNLEQQAVDLYEHLAENAPAAQAQAFRAAYRATVLLGLLKAAPPPRVAELTDLFEQSPVLADELAFTLQRQDKPRQVVNVLLALRDAFGPQPLQQYPGLTAAIALVHDAPQSMRVNENRVVSAGPVALFEYYWRNAERMILPMDTTPATLLTFVVDAAASPAELQWALNKHQGNNRTGALFHTIEYDAEHFRSRTPKAVTTQGFNLPNIERLGGVCADQAYFAMSVGKAIGAPSVYTTAASGEVAHAWVGYFKIDGHRSAWDFNEGRWRDYQGLAGRITDPQTGQRTTDNLVALRGAALFNDRDHRHQAKAIALASNRLARPSAAPTNAPSAAPTNAPSAAQNGDASTSDHAIVRRRLALIEAALKLDPFCIEAWHQIARMAQQDQLNDRDRRHWAGQVGRMAGKRYPGFTFDVLVPLIQSVDDAREQDRYWNRLYDLMSGRPDLQAYARLHQGQAWEASGNFSKAGWSYYEIITNFPNAGRFVVDALQRSESMLIQSGRSSDVIGMYERAWKTMDAPFSQAIEFAGQSNYFRTGQILAERYAQAGMHLQSRVVRKSIGLN